nr:Hint domain-containing protein [Pararoseomonas baculiformis]
MALTRSFFYFLSLAEGGQYQASDPYLISSTLTTNGTAENAILGDQVNETFSVDGISLASFSDPLAYLGTNDIDQTAVIGKLSDGRIVLFSNDAGIGNYYLSIRAPNLEKEQNQYDFENDRPINVTCFALGTRVLTARGEVPVEALSAGDLVATFSGQGAALKPVAWIGRRRVDVARHPEPHRVRPIRIRAGALAEGVPHRDLVVSPEHALFLDGALVHAKTLVNGATILQEAWDAVTYLHIDLGCHDVVLAEGALAESYLNDDGRASFDNAASSPVVALRPGGAPVLPPYEPCARFLRPGAEDNAALLAIAAKLMARAEALGWRCTREPELQLLDGRAVLPEQEGGVYRFAVPAGVASLRLVSRKGRPFGTLPGSTDGRWLGVQLQGLGFAMAGGAETAVPLDHAGLAEGWSHPERRGDAVRRWTTGDAEMAPALAGLCAAGGTLRVRIAQAGAFWERATEEVAGLAATG